MNLAQLLFRCPDCRQGELIRNQSGDQLACQRCSADFPILSGRPVLLRHDNALFPVQAYINPNTAAVDGNPRQGLSRFINRLIPQPSVNLAQTKMLAKLKAKLSTLESGWVLVVGGGNQKEHINRLFDSDKKLRVIFSDIDTKSNVDLFCDGHDLPFGDNSFDAVITTAVLEHVMYPERVAAEIHRVLKIGGILYSEIPFMQQVHEGAYDFTRYSLSGHRRLFNGFEELERGMIAGPATALVWAIENFALAFVSRSPLRKIVKTVSRLSFGWIKYLDYLLEHRPEAMDGASCTYFLGAKIAGQRSDADILAGYVGGKHMRHV